MFPDIQAAAPPTRLSSLTFGREAVSILFGVFNLTTKVHSILEMDLPVAGRSVLRCNCHRAERGGVAGSVGDSAVSLGLGIWQVSQPLGLEPDGRGVEVSLHFCLPW